MQNTVASVLKRADGYDVFECKYYNTSVKYYSQSNKKEQLSGDPELL